MVDLLRKPKWWRLTILLIILALVSVRLHQKVSAEKALVTGGSELEVLIWDIAAFRAPETESGAAREFLLRLDDGRPVLLRLEFADAYNPNPSQVSLTFYPEEPAHSQHGLLSLSAPYNEPVPVWQTKSGKPPPTDEVSGLLKQVAAKLEENQIKVYPFEWEQIKPGFEAAVIRLGYGIRLGLPDVYVLRFDPELFTFKPYHEKEYGPAEPESHDKERNIAGWAERLPDAAALLNGGQYHKSRDYIGILRRDGKYLSSQPHRSWQGYFVSGPKKEGPEAPRAMILDLELKETPYKPEDYLNVMQSLMLFDSRGRIRVNKSLYLAGRAVIGEDKEGKIWFIMNPGAISLHDLAVALKDPQLGLVRALCLDGGFEAQIYYQRAPEEAFIALANYLVFPDETVYSSDMFRSLPSVIAAEFQVR